MERNTTITNPPSFVGAKDYRLRLGSPCIDAGRAHAKFNDADLNGNNRQVGTAIDIGCYEFQRTIDIPSGGDGAGRSISVPMDYIEEKAAPILAANGGDYEATVLATASNRVNKVWECYVAGLNPTNATDVFRTVISMDNGEPVIGWKPDLNEGGTKHERVYTVEGKENLTDKSWAPTNSASRFFRVKVSMP